MLELRNISKYYKSGLFDSHPSIAVEDVSLTLEQGEIIGIFGESGCGKSTIARIAARLLDPSAGEIILKGHDITKLNDQALKKYRSMVQIIFQHPEEAFNPLYSIKSSIFEGYARLGVPKNERINLLEHIAKRVNLPLEIIDRYPGQVSGGEIQRAVLARTLAFNPEFLILDEPTSMLDVSVQAHILNIIRNICDEENTGVLLISHDMDVVKAMCDRVIVMKEGTIVERGGVKDIFNNPSHSYTKSIIEELATL